VLRRRVTSTPTRYPPRASAARTLASLILVMQPIVTGAVEGDLDEAVLRRILADYGITLGLVHGRRGKAFLLQCLNGYNNAAKFAPWVVLVDLDRDCVCATSCVRQWLNNPAPQMCFRIAVRSIEAWLLADRERLVGRVPSSGVGAVDK
jgi:hypothetical protein